VTCGGGEQCSDQGRSLRPVTKATSELPLIHITYSTCGVLLDDTYSG
jgi:hypothetical protein